MTVLVLGAGVSGQAAIRAALDRGHRVRCHDDRPDATLPDDLVAVPLTTGAWDERALVGIERVITSPGFPPASAALVAAERHGVPVITEAGFGFESFDVPIVAVTGTNGKSTVVAETTAMLVASGIDAVAVGNIGSPVSGLATVPAVAVAELSSFQLQYMELSPVAATVLNIAPDHLDWHGSMAAYVAAKRRIVEHMDTTGLFAANADDEAVMAMSGATAARVVACSGTRVPVDGNGVDGDHLIVDGHIFPAPVGDPSFRFDLVVAATLALHAGASPEAVRGSIDAFAPGFHRREDVAEVGGVVFVNDSKATNPHAAVAAARAYAKVRLLAGGRNKDLDLSEIGRVSSVVHLYGFGESGAKIAADAEVPSSVFSTMAEAFDAAADDARPGDVVLLSPGCTSFDEFGSYAERGRRFTDLVHAREGGAGR